MEYAIESLGVWKKFRLYHDRAPTLKEKLIFSRRTKKYDDLWVLKGVDLSIEKGKTIGLIGQNGSGKSTLLKLLTRIIYPDKGTIKLKGKVSSLLELGAGFHPDFSGLENIYMNAAIFGLTRKEIDEKMDEIISFSELEDFVNSPVRTYSSGMYMRLAFSIAINVNPDVLLIDEILAVGDENFQKKCFNKMKSFKALGTTIVIVSHDLGSLEMLCDEIVWLHEGTIVRRGIPSDIVNEYRTVMSEQENQRIEGENRERAEQELIALQGTSEKRWGDGSIEIQGVELLSSTGEPKYTFEAGESCVISMRCRKHRPVETLVFGFGIFRGDNLHCYGTNTFIDKFPLKIDALSDDISVKITIDKLNLIEGEYHLSVASHDDRGTPYDYIVNKVSFTIYSKLKDVGVCRLEHTWEIS